MREKRRDKRYVRKVSIEFTDGNTTINAIASNFSLSGFFIRTTARYPVETELSVTFHIDDGKKFNVFGFVATVANDFSKAGLGVRIKVRGKEYVDFIRETVYRRGEAPTKELVDFRAMGLL